MKKQAAFRILVPILLANIVVFIVPFFIIFGTNPISVDPLQVKLQVGAIALLVLNVSILLSFMIYRKMKKKPKPLTIFLLTLGIFVAEGLLLFRNMTNPTSQNVLGMSSFTMSLVLFVFFNISLVYVISRYNRRKIDSK
jgi:uncharacterized membrane protein